MSESSFSKESYRATLLPEDGESPSSEGSSSGESTESEANQAKTAETEPILQVFIQGKRDGNLKALASAPASEDRKTSKTKRLRYPDRAYVDLLNESILEASGQKQIASEALGPSQIEASYWTSKEKELLFRTLAVRGVGDVQALSQSIRTKSKAEIHVYLSLLQSGVEELNATLPNQRPFSRVEIPSAFDISAGCEEALQLQADGLIDKLAKQDAGAEQNRYVDVWLIDGHYAAETERQLEAESGGDLPDDQQSGGDGPEHTIQTHQPSPGILSAARLLRPEAFIQLAENIFMAGMPGDQNRWHDSDQSLDFVNGPAIYRTAFDDFHNLAISLTRRLVQATLFQAMTRLRSGDGARTNWRPKPEVIRVDVTTALDILGIDTEGWMKYWARLPRKAGLHVYTDSKKYRDGRPSTKNGVKLNYDEVEAELGLSMPNPVLSKEVNGYDSELHASELDSDDFTEASEDSPPSEDGMSPVQNEPVEIDELERSSRPDIADRADKNALPDPLNMELPQSSPGALEDHAHVWATRKRKRSISQSSFTRAEDQYMEAVDLASSKQEETRLWEEVIQQKPHNLVDSRASDKPEIPRATIVAATDTRNWRNKVQYEAEWEGVEEPIAESSFVNMGQIGELGKKRRKKLKEMKLTNDEAPQKHYHHDVNLQEHLSGSENLRYLRDRSA